MVKRTEHRKEGVAATFSELKDCLAWSRDQEGDPWEMLHEQLTGQLENTAVMKGF